MQNHDQPLKSELITFSHEATKAQSIGLETELFSTRAGTFSDHPLVGASCSICLQSTNQNHAALAPQEREEDRASQRLVVPSWRRVKTESASQCKITTSH